ncbi:MAG: hypothetical protein NPIRA05_05330 [Nitrospirales bacterium]|nr:MAG: hypothetical protein NPIRA05_05330 [Nitrospirales bacterium]
MTSISAGRYWLLCCLGIVCAAAILRFSHLGDQDFGVDEILHVYAAQELLQGNGPLLPSGYSYERSLPYSYLVAITGLVSGFTELTLRIPSAILGVVVVFFVYWMTQRWFSPEAGLVAAFLTAFSPLEIAHSREVRMYMLFQLLFLLITFLFYEGFEASSPRGDRPSASSLIGQWSRMFEVRPFYLLSAGLIFFLALGIHKLILPSMSGLIGYVLAMGVVGGMVPSIPPPIRQKYIGSALLLIVGAVVGILLFPDLVAKLVAIIDGPLSWGQDNADNWQYYRWLLLDEYPIIFGGWAIFLLYSLIQHGKAGLLLVCAFVIPFVFHSIVFPMKSYRYFLYVLPFLYISAGIGFVGLIKSLCSVGNSFNAQVGLPKSLWQALSLLVVGGVILGTLINMPWFTRTVKDFSRGYESPHVTDVQHHHWKNAMQYIAQHQKEGDVIISGSAIHTKHYGATQPVYAMNKVRLQLNMERNLQDAQGNIVDYASGAVILKDLEDMRKVIKDNPSGWVMTYLWRGERFWNYPDKPISLTGIFSNEVIRYLETHLERRKIAGSPAIVVWRWMHSADSKL